METKSVDIHTDTQTHFGLAYINFVFLFKVAIIKDVDVGNKICDIYNIYASFALNVCTYLLQRIERSRNSFHSVTSIIKLWLAKA